jgi:hypothetical protein
LAPRLVQQARCFAQTMCCARIAVAAMLTILPPVADGFGVLGHRLAERVADSLLCPDAVAAVEQISGSTSLVGLGAWADRVRYEPAWEHTASWHYINVPDGESVATVSRATSDHVVWAIEQFVDELADTGNAAGRTDALRFVVHFIVDVHQPLHVGRASDRGGNSIEIIVDGRTTNLHRLWDTGVLASARRGEAQLSAAVAAHVRSQNEWLSSAPLAWAEESRALRERVYAFDLPISPQYLRNARAVVERRLAQAGVRLAETLNRTFCVG